MFLKLLMPGHYRSPYGPFEIIKWLKAEGDWVDYGDDLFEFRMDEGIATKNDIPPWSKDYVKAVAGSDAQRTLRQMEQGGMAGRAARPEEHHRRIRALINCRVSAADRGKLCKIYVNVGERQKVGEVVAILSTDADETFDESMLALDQACAFRINNPEALRRDEAW
jgi:hypothetical protein